jgi:hypothetical protein
VPGQSTLGRGAQEPLNPETNRIHEVARQARVVNPLKAESLHPFTPSHYYSVP